MKKINNEKIDEILNKSNIVDIIADEIDLSKKGRNYKSLCPFHSDNNPSFTISPEKQIYKCFSCGASGNIISFLMNYKKKSFVDSVIYLSKKYNIDIDIQNIKNDSYSKFEKNKSNFLNITKKINLLFQNNLLINKNKNIIDYLKTRNINIDTIKYFQIGYCDIANMLNYIKKMKLNLADLEELGIIKIKDEENIVTYFNKRIIFPILDIDNNVLGYSGRSLQNNENKYINSPESIIFKKDNILYNINNATSNILKEKKVYVVEGFFDVISLNNIGISNTIAIMGTSFNNNSFKSISKLTKNIILFLDPDKAGLNSTYKAIFHCVSNGIMPYVVNNKYDLDPSDLVNKKEKKEVLNIINNPIDWLDFLLIKILGKTKQNANDYKNKLDNIFKIINVIQSKTMQEIYFNKISEYTKIDLNDYLNKTNNIKKINNDFKISIDYKYTKALEILILQSLYSYEAFRECKSILKNIQNHKINQIYNVLQNFYNKDNIDKVNNKNKIFNIIEEIELKNWIKNIFFKYSIYYKTNIKDTHRCIDIIKKYELEKQINQIEKELYEENNKSKITFLLNQLTELKQRR